MGRRKASQHTCSECGKRQGVLKFPRGLDQPCKSCAHGPPQPSPRYTCRSCGQEQRLGQFPRGVSGPCRTCLFGPKPRVRFVQGGAPGMGKRHGKRR